MSYDAPVIGPVAPVVAPISPLATSSATLTESFIMNPASLFSDSGGSFTTPATLGGTVGSVKAFGAGRTETLTQTTAANQPYYGTDGASGLPCLQFGINTAGTAFISGMLRSYVGPVGTLMIVYAPYYKGLASNPVQYLALTNTSGGAATSYAVLTRNAGDGVHFSQAQSDGSKILNDISAMLGSPDVLCWRSDPVNGNSTARSGNQLGNKVAGTGTATTGGINAGLGNFYNGSTVMDTTGKHLRGNILGFFTWSGPLSDAEMQGVSAWLAQNLTKQSSAYQGSYFGLFFYGDKTEDEASGAACAAAVRTGDFIHWNHIPINEPGLSNRRDYGIGYDPVTNAIYAMITAGGGHSFLMAIRDKLNIVGVGSTIIWTAVSGTDSTQSVWAPAFVKNKDSSLWKDGAGLPRVSASWYPNNTGSGLTFTGALCKPVDTTWTAGGPWNPATNIAWTAAPSDIIDTSIVFNPDDGLFHMVFCVRTSTSSPSGSYINKATATSLDGNWTLQGPSTSDPLGIGTGYEGPQLIYHQPTGTWRIMLDGRGNGYACAISTSGINGPYSTIVPVVAPFCAEQGEFTMVPQGW